MTWSSRAALARPAASSPARWRTRIDRHRRPVLVLSKLRAGGQRYYLEATDRRNGPGAEAPGYWLVAGASGVCEPGGSGSWAASGVLGAPVEEEPLALLLDGRHPHSGEDLGADRRRVTVAGFDLTFCAPKSVSLLHALGEPEVSRAVSAGHERAVAAAFSYVEDHALAVRRDVPGARRVPVEVEPVPAAAFLHRASRALDPHLHTHVVLGNIGRGPDGTWSALDGRGLYAHRAATDALYHAQLRHELTCALGVAWEPPHHGRADVAGVGEEARRAFSRRSGQILADLAERGLVPDDGALASPRARAVAGVATRARKDLSVPVDELVRGWRRRAREAGLGPQRLEAVLGRVPSLAPATVGELTPGAVAEALEAVRLGSSEDALARRQLVRAWAATRQLGEPARSIEGRVDRFLSGPSVGDAPFGRDRGDATPGSRRRDAPGVAEARHVLSERALDRGTRRRQEELAERRLLEELLTRRGMSPANDRSHEHDLGVNLGR